MSHSLWNPMCYIDDALPIAERAEGIYLYDDSGKQWIDANSGLWNMPLGGLPNRINNKITEQLSKICYVNPYEFETPLSIQLASQILDLVGNHFEKCIFTCSGSESIELSIKLIRLYHTLACNRRKKKIMVLEKAYHGNYYGSMSVSSYDRELALKYAPLLDDIIEIPFLNTALDEDPDISVAISVIEANRDSIAGFIIEPVLGSAGVINVPNKLIQYISDFANANDCILAFDEVATGFGRTGAMFRFQSLSVKPDMIALSKGINNGVLPFGCVCVSEKICHCAREKKEPLFHLSTQNCNPVCCASALATISIYRENDFSVIRGVEKKGQYLEEKLRDSLSASLLFHNIRRCGLMLAVEIRYPDKSLVSYHDILSLKKLLMKKRLIMEWSYIEKTTSSIVLFPAFIYTKTQLEHIANIIASSLGKLEKRLMC